MPTSPAELSQSVSDRALREIACLGTMRSYRRRAVVFSHGDRGDTLFVILKGRVEIYLPGEDGRDAIIGRREAGECFGEMSLGEERTRSASVVCLEACTFSVVSRTALLEAIQFNPDLAMYLITTLIQRARLTTVLVTDLGVGDVYGRVKRLLLRMARPGEDGVSRVDELLSQAEVGRRVGASRDMVNRIFRALAAGGYLRFEGRRIVLPRGTLPRAF